MLQIPAEIVVNQIVKNMQAVIGSTVKDLASAEDTNREDGALPAPGINQMVILRGLPGSGKSYVTSLLQRQLGTESVAVCSADHFFGRGVEAASYQESFDVSKLVSEVVPARNRPR